MELEPSSLKRTSRSVGVLYLLWVLTGVFALYYVPSRIDLKGGAADVAQSILSHELLYRTTTINDLVSSCIWIYMVLLLYRLFRHVDAHQARLLVALVLVQVPVMFLMEAFGMAALMTLKGDILKSFALGQRQEFAMMFLRINDYGALALATFWGVWLFPLATLVYKSRFLPRALGVWLGINGLAYVAISFTGILFPPHKEVISKIAFPALLGEIAFMLWMLIKGAAPQSARREPSPS